MIYYAVIGTNVLVSALLSSHDDAATVLVVEKLFSGEIIPLFSDEILKSSHIKEGYLIIYLGICTTIVAHG